MMFGHRVFEPSDRLVDGAAPTTDPRRQADYHDFLSSCYFGITVSHFPQPRNFSPSCAGAVTEDSSVNLELPFTSHRIARLLFDHSTNNMVTNKSHPGGTEPLQPLSPTQHPSVPTSPPSKRDLTSWWRQFKRNTRKEESKEKPQGIFGIPLTVSIKYANVAISLTNDSGESFIYGYVPIVVAKCGVFLKEKATDVEGIFRLNGSAKRIKDLQEIFDSPERYGKGLDWTGYTVHDAANVLRRYLNQLPEPIVPLEFYERFREPLRTYQKEVQLNEPSTETGAFDHAKAVASYQQLIRELPPLNKQLLLYILDLLAVFASKSDQNRMPSANLSAIFQPGLLSHPQHDMSPDEYKLSQDVLIFLIENQDHFLFGMNGTAADEQTMKEVEGGGGGGGLAPPPATHSGVRRSVSSASAGADSFRKFGGLRRNVSVSSKNSRNSNNTPSPATPTSLGGVGVHRSNTLPSKMSPAMRYGRVTEAMGVNSSGRTSAQNSRSSTPHPVEEKAPAVPGVDSATGLVYIHTATHGPLPKNDPAPPASIQPTPEKPALLETVTPSSPPPAVVTPTKDRKLSSLFSKSPPPSGEYRDVRQPNRLKKKRIPGSASESAQSSAQSLQAATSNPALKSVQSLSGTEANEANEGKDDGESTPKPLGADDLPHKDGKSDKQESGPTADTSLRPYGSRTPSMNSRSSFTDYSDVDPPEDSVRSDRKENRRSWRFHRSSKRSSEQVGLGLGSPPLLASNLAADHSTSSIGHHSSRSSPSDTHNLANDPSYQPLSLDAEVNSGKETPEPEKRSLFGKFKAKVAQVRDGVKDDRDRTRSPVHSDPEKSTSSQTLSPIGKDSLSNRPAPIDVTLGPKDGQNANSPTSPPHTSSGMPPAIPEEPRTPDSPVAISSLPKEPAITTTTTTTTTATITAATDSPGKDDTTTAPATTAASEGTTGTGTLPTFESHKGDSETSHFLGN
ncbi:hypothetical protein FE257_009686 [Aspergillus nanangensis]|uniref:Rho-GAP domain-containing protein n=1 Tax=Aspergillus nanangensis TaxID=2582783 RepID=A0AAD4CL40_ASPNN|nr:hypothetical protein FE257_009686 [Aspergillus nanangensis]